MSSYQKHNIAFIILLFKFSELEFVLIQNDEV